MTNVVNNGTNNFIATTNLVQSSDPSFSPGTLPLGAIIATMPHLTGAFNIASGQVVEGWALTNGQTIPNGNTVIGNTPNLSDGRFVLGNSTAGSTGGSNSITLTAANTATHTHSVSIHNHTSSVGFSDNLSAGCSHYHGASGTPTTGSGCDLGVHFYSVVGTRSVWWDQAGWSGPWSSYTDTNWQMSYHSHSWSVGRNLPGSMPHSHTLVQGGAVCDFTNNTTSAGSGSSITNLPPYMTTVYIIRVK